MMNPSAHMEFFRQAPGAAILAAAGVFFAMLALWNLLRALWLLFRKAGQAVKMGKRFASLSADRMRSSGEPAAEVLADEARDAAYILRIRSRQAGSAWRHAAAFAPTTVCAAGFFLLYASVFAFRLPPGPNGMLLVARFEFGAGTPLTLRRGELPPLEVPPPPGRPYFAAHVERTESPVFLRWFGFGPWHRLESLSFYATDPRGSLGLEGTPVEIARPSGLRAWIMETVQKLFGGQLVLERSESAEAAGVMDLAWGEERYYWRHMEYRGGS